MIYIRMSDRHICVQTDGTMSDDEPQFEYEVDFGAAYSDESEAGSMQALLDEKDKNLMLAAELGKALLEKNSELEKRLEQTTEEYSQQIEILEQEKYGLHMKLENLEGEYDNTVRELQYDLGLLKDRLDTARQEHTLSEKDKQHRINELSAQNERLLEELQQVKSRAHQFEAELQTWKDSRLAKENTKNTYKIEHLQEQISSLTARGSEVERHLAKVTEEKETLLHVIDETQDKIKVLERQKHDQEEELHKKDGKIRELHERVSHLTVQLDQMTEKASTGSGHSMTLFSELCQMAGPHEVPMATESPNNPYPPSMFGDDDIECDDDDFIMTSSSPIRFEEEMRSSMHGDQAKMETEIIHAYKNLRHLCRTIKEHMGDKVTEFDETGTESSEGTGSLDSVVNELKETIQEAMSKTNQTQSMQLQEIRDLQARVGELSEALTTCQGRLDKLQEQLQHRDTQLQEKSFKVTELSKQVTSQQEDIRVLSGQRDKLQEQMAGDRGRPQMYSAMALLRHARRERDAAVEKRYSLEKELQQCRYEIIVLNHQLIEAIQQKNSVSSLLDQWQSDMADLLGVQMDKHIKGAMNFDLKSPEDITQDSASGTTETSDL